MMIKIKEFFRLTKTKIVLMSVIGVISLYGVREVTCGASFFFTFCYKAFGFPFKYLVTGDINVDAGYLRTLALGAGFVGYGNFLFNLISFFINILSIYLAACFIGFLLDMLFLKSNTR